MAKAPALDGEDFVRDGEDIADLMGDGAHLVGHSYGGLGVLFAAARRPDATLSMTLLEPGAFALPPELIPAAVPLVPVLRRGRRIWEPGLPLTEVAAASFPKLVVSGGHSAGFDAICDDLADRIGASRMVVEGAGHEIQFTGPPVNQALLALWRSAGSDRDAIV